MQAKPHSSKRSLILLVLTAFAWPPIYFLFVHQHVESVVSNQHVAEQELQTLLGAKRFTLKVPAEKEGWFLSFESVIDGVPTSSGASTVQGGTEITLLVRRLRDTKKIEYCWIMETQVSRGIFDDPLITAGVITERNPGLIEPGDWLFLGGRKSVQAFPVNGADFEVRLVLAPPHVPEKA